MNYIKEMNAFYDWLEINDLSPSAINLWYALMHINNKAGWAETFTVAESVLCVKTGLTDRTLRKVRNELKQKGRIDFTSRKGGKAPVYQVRSFFSPEIISADSAGGSAEGRSGDSAGDSSALIKLNETKPNETSSSSEKEWAVVMDFYQSNLQKGVSESPFNNELIGQWFDELGSELLLAAMKVAAKAESKGVKMVEGILKNWEEAGVETIEDARKYEKEFRDKKKKPVFKNNVTPFKKQEEPKYDYGF